MEYKCHIINTSFQDMSPDIPLFFKNSRHVFIMTNAGRPIYVQYGNEIKTGIFLATMNAILQKFLVFYFEDKEKQLLFKILHHNVCVYILQRNQICYVCTTTKLNDSEFLIYQMLDHLNNQLISIVTDQVNIQLSQRPNFDLTHQVGGSRNLITLAVKNGLSSPCISFNSFCPLPMAGAMRTWIHDKLKEVKDVVCTLLLTETMIVDICKAKNQDFKIADILIIQQMLQGQPQLRKSENWIPICLPGLSCMGFVYAYIRFFQPNLGIVMISDDSSLDKFSSCKEQCNTLIEKLEAQNTYNNLLLQNQPITPKCLEQPTTIRHFITKHISGQIFVPQYHVFGKVPKVFKQHMHHYAELYKEFLINSQDSEGKQNYFSWSSNGYGITQYHEVIIMFCFVSQIDLNQVSNNVHLLHRIFKSEELHNFFILK